MKKNNKGFTLIELLAIIVILAIIAVITVPIILNIIENSRKGAATDSAYGFKDAVNKWYVSKLSEDHYFKISGEYSVTNGVLNGLGVNNVEIPVSGDKPSSGKLHYTNNVLDDGCLVIGDYKITFKSDGSVNETIKGNCDDYVINGGSGQVAEPLEIGTDIDYTTSLNGVTLDNWKVFLSDSNYTYLIYGDYLPVTAVDTSNIIGINTYNTYGVYANNNRANLLNAMITNSYWSDLINNGEISETALSADVKRNSNVWAMGAPTVDLWVNSWNENGYTHINIETTTSTMTDGLNGYYIYKDGESSTNTYINLSTIAVEYGDALYFPHQSNIDDCYGYWLASPSASNENNIMRVCYDGNVDSIYWSGSTMYGPRVSSFRPIIKLPTRVVSQ